MSISDLIMTVIFVVISISCLIIALIKDADVASVTILGVLSGLISLVYFGVIIAPKTPNPIDVYRGKTTLQITYQDSIPVDTTVVWKEEFGPNK